jgi:ABC-2 type transport system ATP-binding protein
MSATMILVKDVVYDYPASRALHGVSFEVEAGTVLALVGPNGAGKTTLMRCVAALDAPLEGTICVAGLDTQEDPRGVHAAIGYLPDFFGLYDELSVRRALIYAARSRAVSEADTPRAVEEAAARVQLTDRLEARAGELSRGLRQRLAIAQTIVHRPSVLLLDEPAAGLDPEARRSLSDLIVRLAGEGMTIVVSSHILAELEDYSTRMLMIRDGRVAGGGVVAAGSGQSADAGFAVSFTDPPKDLRKRLEALGLTVTRLAGADAVVAAAPGTADAEILTKLVGAGLKVSAFQPARRTLEDAYLSETGR